MYFKQYQMEYQRMKRYTDHDIILIFIAGILIGVGITCLLYKLTFMM